MKNLYLTFALIFSFSLSSFATADYSKGAPCDVAFLGIHSDRVSPSKARMLGFENPHGVYVTQVLPNTAAEEAGLQPFDYIIAIGEFEMTDNQGLHRVISNFEPGDESKIFFIRQGKERSVNVEFGSKGSWSHIRPSVKKSFLGVQKMHHNDRGVKVDVIENSTAQSIGLQDGDVITEIDGIQMVDWKDLTTMMKNKASDEDIKVTYVREGAVKSASGRLQSYGETQANRWEDKEEKLNKCAEKLEKKCEKLGERMEIIGEEIEEEAEELVDEIEERLEEFFDRNRDRNNDDNDENEDSEEEDVDEDNDDRGGFNDEIMINRNPRSRMDTPRPRPDVSTLSANITEASVDELMNLNTGRESIAGLDNNLQIDAISFVPNATSGMFDLEFELPQTGNTIVQFFNESGRMIYEYELGGFSGTFKDEVDVSQNAPGVYYLIVNQNNETATRKVQFDLQ